MTSVPEMTQSIPRKKPKTDHGLSRKLAPTTSNSESTVGATITKAAALSQIRKLEIKYGDSNASSFGVANLFFQVGSEAILRRAQLTKRCISSNDCVPGRTYLDTTSFSCVLKKDKCPLIAFSINGSDDTFRSRVTKFNPMGKDKDLSILYINL
eukprot:scaffold7888_cov78-Skeletonema_dohrnii-CCMP3373.AAC.3